MRMGQFSRVQHQYGMSIGVVKAPDNKWGSLYPSELDNLDLTEIQRDELAQRIHDLFLQYQAEREYYAGR